MIYTKTNRPDRRFRVNKTIAAKEFLFWQKYGNYVVVGILGALAGIIVTTSLWRAGHQPSVNPKSLNTIESGDIKNLPGTMMTQSNNISSNVIFTISQGSVTIPIGSSNFKTVKPTIFESKNITGTSWTKSPKNFISLFHEVSADNEFSDGSNSSRTEADKGTVKSSLPSPARIAAIFLARINSIKLFSATSTIFSNHIRLDNSTITEANKGTNKPGAKKLIQEVKAWETPFCFDPITCIRDVGEEIGASNQDIMTMIRIARCESGLRPEAVGINTNKTIDRGIFQINSIHKNLSNADAFNFEKNIRYAWKMQREQGFRPWVCYLKVKNF